MHREIRDKKLSVVDKNFKNRGQRLMMIVIVQLCVGICMCVGAYINWLGVHLRQ